jgi:hypothetical protein
MVESRVGEGVKEYFEKGKALAKPQLVQALEVKPV